MRPLNWIILALCTMVPSLTFAQPPPPRGPLPFESYDQDQSGDVSREEFDAVRGERLGQNAQAGRPVRGAANMPAFEEIDAGGDGKIDRDEFNAFHQQRRGHGRMGQGAGAAGNSPRGGRSMPTFADFDRDGDAKITEQEFNDARGKRIAERAQQGGQMRNLANAPSFADLDTNKDGALSSDEFAVAHRPPRNPPK